MPVVQLERTLVIRGTTVRPKNPAIVWLLLRVTIRQLIKRPFFRFRFRRLFLCNSDLKTTSDLCASCVSVVFLWAFEASRPSLKLKIGSSFGYTVVDKTAQNIQSFLSRFSFIFNDRMIC